MVEISTNPSYGYVFVYLGKIKTGWWFQIFLIFTPTWGNDPIWLIFFKWVETTNQKTRLNGWFRLGRRSFLCVCWITSCDTTAWWKRKVLTLGISFFRPIPRGKQVGVFGITKNTLGGRDEPGMNQDFSSVSRLNSADFVLMTWIMIDIFSSCFHVFS